LVLRKTTVLFLLAVLAWRLAAAEDKGDTSELRRKIESLEQRLNEERARAEKERQAAEERLRALETQIDELRAKSEAAPAAAAAAPSLPSFAGILNPAIGASLNFVFRGSNQKMFAENGKRIDNQPNLREAEIDARAAVDPYADGVLIVSIESPSPGDFETSVEEGYVTLKKLPFLDVMPLGLSLDLGRFRPEFGKINKLHTHDLPQTTRPLVIEEFLGQDGFSEDGVSGRLFVPTPWDEEESLDLTLQALSGDVAIASGGSNNQGFLGHARWFRTLGSASDLELGGSSYYARNDSPGLDAEMYGADLLYRWKPLRGGESTSFLLGTEYLFANRHFLESDATGAEVHSHTEPQGFYGYAQYQPAARWYVGVRGDWTESIDDTAVRGSGVMPYVSYYFSEFLRFRLDYEHIWGHHPEEQAPNTVYLETNVIFGAHPPEPFWVNK
jgi:hypothetical protein